MTDFATKVSGIPCVCRVVSYRPATYARMGGAMEDADEPTSSEFEYELHKAKGKGRLKWLEAKVTDDDLIRLEDEYELHVTANKYMYDDY